MDLGNRLSLEKMAPSAPAPGRVADAGVALAPTRRRPVDLARIACVLAVVGFVALSLAYSSRRFPAWDEGLYADVTFSIAEDGRMRSRAMGPVGTFGFDPLPGMDERTYWTTAAYPMLVGTWMRVAGTGLVQLRLPSMVFGLLLFAAWIAIVRSLTGSRIQAYAAAALIALGSHVLWAGSMGRPDMMAVSLATAAIAAYLHLRGRSMRLALCAVAALLSLAVQAHPMALVEGAALGALMLVLDRRNLRIPDLLLATGVGLLLLVPWGLYILQDPQTFRAQWGANSYERAEGLTRPLQALVTDLPERYFPWHFGPGLSRIRALELIALGACFAIAASVRSVRRTQGLGLLALLAGTVFVSLALLDGKRWIQYFLHVFPFYSALAAVVICRLAEPGASARGTRLRRALAATLVLMLILPGVGGISLRVLHDPYTTEFLPTVRALEPYRATGADILAPSELGFALGFDGEAFRDDMKMRSTPDVYVRSQYTLLDAEGGWQGEVKQRLATEFEKVFVSDRYTIFARP